MAGEGRVGRGVAGRRAESGLMLFDKLLTSWGAGSLDSVA